MMRKAAPPWYSVCKFGVIILLMANAIVFYVQGTASEALDSLAWLTLLALFELETRGGDGQATRGAVLTIHVVRLCAGVGVATAAAGYYVERAWLDAANASIWIAIVALLEFKVRFPRWFAKRSGSTGSVAALLYTSLAGLVVAWAWRSEWFDAYDATLWIVAFAAIEMNVLMRSVETNEDRR